MHFHYQSYFLTSHHIFTDSLLVELHWLLACHIRRHLSYRALCLQARLLRLQPFTLRPGLQVAPWHSRCRCVLLRHCRHGCRHEPGMVGRSHCAQGRGGTLWWRCRIRAGFCICVGELFGLEDFGVEVFWAMRKPKVGWCCVGL